MIVAMAHWLRHNRKEKAGVPALGRIGNTTRMALTNPQRKYLRGQAHHLDPAVMVGKQGVTDALIVAVNASLAAHELIKIRFIEFKERRKELTAEIAARTGSEVAGIIGHVAILYRQHPEPEKRKVQLPE